MKLFFLILTVCSLQVSAQTDELAVKQTITNLFDGMRKSDSILLKSAFAPEAILQTIDSRTAEIKIRTDKVAAFVTGVSRPHKEIYDERISFDLIKIDGDLASVWTPYQFYVDDKFSHCGVNSFQLVRLGGEWKIQYLIDTRRKDACK